MSKLQSVLFVIFLGLGPLSNAQTDHDEKNVDGPRPTAQESVERNLASQAPSDPNKMVESISSANQQLRGLFDAPKAVGERSSSSPFESMPAADYPIPNR